jgi:hypothetical protein
MRGAFGELTCVNCNCVLRDSDVAYEINDRAWCAPCAAPYTGLRAAFAGTLGMFFRLAGVLVIFGGGFVFSTFGNFHGVGVRVIGASSLLAAAWWRATSPGVDVVARKLTAEDRRHLLR